ncbi:MobC family plasmid mobilization relaxosome protein [Hyphomicrobium sp. B1]|uniref:MobC family plasmid mobilization relaxosome protein n=1 Tax=Hyphomicrobium sp. B1 TaxID=3075651 RepID=UPI003C2F97F9
MPTKGYRKGLSDHKEPLPRFVRTRLSELEFKQLAAEAVSRSATISSLARAVLIAHGKGQRAELPHARGPSNELIRQLTRVGNNLNQLARQANAGTVAVPADDIRRCLDTINTLARTL